MHKKKKKSHSHYKSSFPTIQTRNKADIKLLMLEKDTFSGFAWTQKWEWPMQRIMETGDVMQPALLWAENGVFPENAGLQ